MKRTAMIAVWFAVGLCASGESVAVTETSQSLERRASIYRNEGKLTEGEELDRRAVAIAKTAGNGLAVAMIDLARTLCAEARYRDAQTIAMEADAVAGEHGLDHARALSTLALIYREQMKYADAEKEYRVSVAAFEKATGPTEPETAVVRTDLGYVLSMEGKFREARTLLERSLPILEANARRPETASAFMRLGMIAQGEGKFKEASRELRQALDIDTAELGPESIRTANDETNLGFLEFQRGHTAEAEELVSRALAIERKWPGPALVLKGFTLADLAAIYVKEKRLGKAEQIYREAAAILETNAGAADTRVANILYSYSSLLRALKRYSDAEQVEVRATAIRVRIATRKE
jgi:tetratricopeptide (TPR) repeat protein